jgi:hypothetical protein
MADGEQRRSLWADPPPDERPPDVVARVLPDEPEEPPTAPPEAPARQPVRPRALAIGAVAALVIVVIASAISARGSLVVEDVPSSWGDVPMTCKTARFEEGGLAVELFRCHAVGDGKLPAGIYQSPDSLWTSDITRVDARANAMVISRNGQLKGWAAY